MIVVSDTSPLNYLILLWTSRQLSPNSRRPHFTRRPASLSSSFNALRRVVDRPKTQHNGFAANGV